MPGLTINQLIEISTTKLSHLNKVYELTLKQREAIDSDDIDKLNKYISDKQDAIDTIDILDKAFLEKYTKLKSQYSIENLNDIDKNTYPHIKDLQVKITEISEMLKSIMEVEKYNNEKIKGSFEDVKTKLKQIKLGKKLNTGYNKSPYGTMFIDEKK